MHRYVIIVKILSTSYKITIKAQSRWEAQIKALEAIKDRIAIVSVKPEDEYEEHISEILKIVF